MTRPRESPYLRFGLEPDASLEEITARLRELAEDAADDAARAALREAWNELSRSPARRLTLALEAGPAGVPLPQPRRAPPLPRAPAPSLASVIAPAPLAPRAPPGPRPAAPLAFLIDPGERALVGPLQRGATPAPRRTR